MRDTSAIQIGPLQPMPACVGVGLKAEHARTILETRPDIGFFEIHAENYMGAGGPPHRYLTAVRERYPLSVHGVGLSIGGGHPLDCRHLDRLKALVDRYQPALVSEHLAWSTHEAGFLNDLLPIPYTAETLTHVAERLDRVQNVLGRRVLLENPSTYVAFAESIYAETEFIAELARRTGCGLLLDVNNVYIASTNQGWNALDYIDAFPLNQVCEIHLAGHAREADECDRPLLIDTHDRPVADIVWALYAYTIRRAGPIATLIEWDAALPDWTGLKAEADRAETVMTSLAEERRAVAC